MVSKASLSRLRQTKGAETDMLGLTSPRHTSTLPILAVGFAQRAVVAERFGEQSDSSEADLPKSSRLPFYFTITQVG